MSFILEGDCMIQGCEKEHRHVSWSEHGRNLGGSVEWLIGKDNDGTGSRDRFSLSCSGNSGSTGSTRRYQEGPGSPGRGREHAIPPGNASARVHECYSG